MDSRECRCVIRGSLSKVIFPASTTTIIKLHIVDLDESFHGEFKNGIVSSIIFPNRICAYIFKKYYT